MIFERAGAQRTGGSCLAELERWFFCASMMVPGATASAGNLPDLLLSPRNSVPECVTPGRLTAYLRLRNPELDARYESIATEYKRQGAQLGLRWDYAFYQMVVETGALSYWRGNRHGDVKASQNNFAGLGATGRGVRGESFKDIATGVRAHLEHLMLYAGRPVEVTGGGAHAQGEGVGCSDVVAARVRQAHHLFGPGSQVGTGNESLRRHAESRRRSVP